MVIVVPVPVALHVQSTVNASFELVVTVTAEVTEAKAVIQLAAVVAVALFSHCSRSQPTHVVEVMNSTWPSISTGLADRDVPRAGAFAVAVD